MGDVAFVRVPHTDMIGDENRVELRRFAHCSEGLEIGKVVDLA